MCLTIPILEFAVPLLSRENGKSKSYVLVKNMFLDLVQIETLFWNCPKQVQNSFGLIEGKGSYREFSGQWS